jgi:hypothetical protein
MGSIPIASTILRFLSFVWQASFLKEVAPNKNVSSKPGIHFPAFFLS